MPGLLISWYELNNYSEISSSQRPGLLLTNLKLRLYGTRSSKTNSRLFPQRRPLDGETGVGYVRHYRVAAYRQPAAQGRHGYSLALGVSRDTRRTATTSEGVFHTGR